MVGIVHGGAGDVYGHHCCITRKMIFESSSKGVRGGQSRLKIGHTIPIDLKVSY